MTAPDDPPGVLIVEDERDVAEMFELWLQEAYEVRMAFDGETALESIDESVSVVLLDRRMPGLSGDEVLERIRERDVDSRVAIVSAVSPDFDIIEMGFDEYVNKPVSKDELTDAVERMVGLAAYDRDLREFYGLVSKKTAIDAEMRPIEREANEEYAALDAEIEALSGRLDTALDELEGDDFDRLFRRIG